MYEKLKRETEEKPQKAHAKNVLNTQKINKLKYIYT